MEKPSYCCPTFTAGMADSKFYYLYCFLKFKHRMLHIDIAKFLICTTDNIIKHSIRKIADLFSSKGYYTIVPKLLDPTMDGTEGGDGEN
jgi:hypothetical protein